MKAFVFGGDDGLDRLMRPTHAPAEFVVVEPQDEWVGRMIAWSDVECVETFIKEDFVVMGFGEATSVFVGAMVYARCDEDTGAVTALVFFEEEVEALLEVGDVPDDVALWIESTEGPDVIVVPAVFE